MHADMAHQGHRYNYGGQSVLAMQTGVVVEVRVIDMALPYPLGAAYTVKASWLKPEPMKYFHGGVR